MGEPLEAGIRLNPDEILLACPNPHLHLQDWDLGAAPSRWLNTRLRGG